MKLEKYIGSSDRLKKIIRFVSTKTFLGALFFAVSLWAYVNLNNEYLTFVELPLEVELPTNRALEAPLPEYISIEVRGVGWNIINLQFFNTSAKVDVDLTSAYIAQDEYRISRIDLLKSVLYLSNVEPIDVLPESIILKTGQVGEYDVAVEPLYRVIPREGFMLVGGVQVSPSKITIRGNKNVVSEIDKWSTEKVAISDVYGDFNFQAPLEDSLSNIITLSQNTVTLSGKARQSGSKTLYGVELKLRGGTLPEGHVLMPEKFNITISGPIGEIEEITKDDIYAKIDYANMMEDSTGIIRPEIVLPEHVRALKVEPKFARHFIRVKSLSSVFGDD